MRSLTLSLIEPYRQQYLGLIIELLGKESNNTNRNKLYYKIWVTI